MTRNDLALCVRSAAFTCRHGTLHRPMTAPAIGTVQNIVGMECGCEALLFTCGRSGHSARYRRILPIKQLTELEGDA